MVNISPTWTQCGPASWMNDTAPGYEIVQVGDHYEILLRNRQVGVADRWDEAHTVVEIKVLTEEIEAAIAGAEESDGCDISFPLRE